MTAAPPLLVLAAGGKPRPRRERVPVPKESKLQADVALLLHDHLLPDWRATHFPAGEARDVITGARLKRFGLKRGWPDCQLLSPAGLYHGLELKRLGEGLGEDQKSFRAWARAHNVPYAVAWTMDEALEAFDRWGCLRIKVRANDNRI
jgi:hypothetical protein